MRRRPVPPIDIPVRIVVALILAFGAGASAGMYTYAAMQVAPHTVEVDQ